MKVWYETTHGLYNANSNYQTLFKGATIFRTILITKGWILKYEQVNHSIPTTEYKDGFCHFTINQLFGEKTIRFAITLSDFFGKICLQT